MNKMMNSFLNFVPNESWIKTSSGLPWLKLNIAVPLGEIQHEAEKIYPQSVYHRSEDKFSNYSHNGWRSITLYGKNSTTTYQTDDKFEWTEISSLCPYTVEFIKQHWLIDKTTGRIRFMYLDPGGYILPHVDRSTKGFSETNIAITNPKNCIFRFLDYGTVPFDEGSAFHVDISNKHFVVNDSDTLRIHLIVHGNLKAGILKSSYEQNFYS